MCLAAVAAATSAGAPGAGGSVATTRVYRFWTVLIASDMATCTMAKVRNLGLLPTSLDTRALVVYVRDLLDGVQGRVGTLDGSVHSWYWTLVHPDTLMISGVCRD